MLKNWIRIFLYQIKNNKFFTALNVLGLSMGIAGLIFAILYWNEEHSYNFWNPEKENVFQVITDLGDGNIWATNTSAIEPFFKSEIPEIQEHCYLNTWYYNEVIEYKGKKQLFAKILDSQNNFFSFFPFDFIKGSGQTAIQDSNCIALSEETARNLFGDEEPMGKQVLYSGRTLVVKGIYKINGKSSFEPMAVTNLIDNKLKGDREQWGNFSYGLLIKVTNPSEAIIVRKKLMGLYFEHRIKKSAKESNMTPEAYIKKYGNTKIILEQLKTSRLESSISGYPEGKGNYQFLLIMLGLSILILILSVVNYVNLATANAIKRAKEVGVRKVIGASKGNIIRQFVFETVLLVLFSIFFALVIVELSLPYYNEFLNKQLLMQGSQFYIELLLIFIVVVVMAGIFPAIYVSNFETLKVLRGNFGRSKSGVWLRNGMLIVQFGIASFFIIGSYIVYQQIEYLNNKELGFNGDQVLDVYYRIQDTTAIFNRYQSIRQEVLKIKGVKQVGAGAFTFGEGAGSSSGFTYNDENIQAQNIPVDFGLLKMMKIKVLEGRDLSPDISSDTISNILLNETAVRMMNEKNFVGREIEWNGRKLKVVGIVSDFQLNGPHEKVLPMVFMHFKTVFWMASNMNHVFIKIAPENMDKTISSLDRFWTTKVDPVYPFNYDFVDKNFKRTYEDYVKQKNLFSLLNVVVIIIALFGLFALASYSIQRRMKEIAIRKTLGAETKTLLRELSKQYIIFCIIGFLIALFPVYYLLDKWLDNFANRISISLFPFVMGFVFLLLLTLIVVLSRAYQATRVNVLKYLKYE